MSDTDSSILWLPLLNIAGLHGLIPNWEMGRDWSCLDRSYGLRLPDGKHRLAAHLRVPVETPARLEINAFEGVSVEEVPECDGTTRYEEKGNGFPLTLPAGESTLTFHVDTSRAGNLFTARLCAPDFSPLAEVRVKTAISAWHHGLSLSDVLKYRLDGKRADTQAPPLFLGFSAWHYFNRLMEQPGSLQLGAGQDFTQWRARLLEAMTPSINEPPGNPRQSREQPKGELEKGIKHSSVWLIDEMETMTLFDLLVPHRPNGAGLLCLHGHGYEYGETTGVDGGDKGRRRVIEQYNYAYALEAARRGYVALTPLMRGFGIFSDLPQPPKDPCDANFFRAIHYGLSMVGLHLRDLRLALDYLCARPEVDAERLGCIGLSFGGRMTMYLAATDERIKVACPSGALNTFKERLSLGSSCGSQFVPGLLQYCDTPEIFGLIAPRPMLIELGANDGCCPEIYATEAYRQIKRIYEAAGAADRLALDIFPGGHRWHGVGAWEWLERWL